MSVEHPRGVIAWFAYNPVAANLLMLVIIAVGLGSAFTIQRAMFPTVDIEMIFITAPYLFLQLWLFIAPGLYAKEKKFAVPFVIVSMIMFLGGAAFVGRHCDLAPEVPVPLLVGVAHGTSIANERPVCLGSNG